MAKSRVIGIRLQPAEEWLLSYLKPEYAGQPLCDRLRNALIDHASAELGIHVEAPSPGVRMIHRPKGMRKGQEPVPRPWPVIDP